MPFSSKEIAQYAEKRRQTARINCNWQACYFWGYVRFVHTGHTLCAFRLVPGDTATLPEVKARIDNHFNRRNKRNEGK